MYTLEQVTEYLVDCRGLGRDEVEELYTSFKGNVSSFMDDKEIIDMRNFLGY